MNLNATDSGSSNWALLMLCIIRKKKPTIPFWHYIQLIIHFCCNYIRNQLYSFNYKKWPVNRFLVYHTHETKSGNLQFPEENVMCEYLLPFMWHVSYSSLIAVLVSCCFYLFIFLHYCSVCKADHLPGFYEFVARGFNAAKQRKQRWPQSVSN